MTSRGALARVMSYRLLTAAGQVLLPNLVNVRQNPVRRREHKAGRVRFAFQEHCRLFGRAVAFFGVAAATARNDVFPTRPSAPAPRGYVVQSQVAGFAEAILTGVVVAPEDIFTVEGDAVTRGAFDELFQANHARYWEDLARGAQHFIRVLDAFGDFVHQEGNRTFD